VIRSKNKKLHTQAFYSYFQALARLDGLHSLPHCFFFCIFNADPFLFLSLYAIARSDQTGRWRHYVVRLSTHSSTRLSINLSVIKLVNTILWKRTNQFWCQWTQVIHGIRT